MNEIAFATAALPEEPTEPAPDGSEVRALLGLPAGRMSHFQLPPGCTTTAVAHRTVAEIWYVLSGLGEIWRRQGEREEIAALEPGVCVTIPLGTSFQFRALGAVPLAIVAVTLPPWPGNGEAIEVLGPWTPASRPEKPHPPRNP